MQPVKNVAKKDSILPPRIRELQKKIQDKEYVNYAVDRIAMIMSCHIVDYRIEKKL